MGSTDGRKGPSALVRAAARGELPDWAAAGEERRAHMARVASLLAEWAAGLRLPAEDRIRWAAAGWLHDVLREADPEALRDEVPPHMRDLPPGLLHGPAAAERLGDDADPALLDAVRYHTIGHPALDRLGRAVYLADFLEPAREFEREWRAEMRDRMPEEMDEVLRQVVSRRLEYLVGSGRGIRPETAEFWSSLASGGE